MSTTDWETVIGLEVHCELKTETGLFCGCRNSFGDEPNTNICPTCLGLPGSLPVLNRQAVELAMRIGEALHCEIKPSIFHRKNYFYPDMPKDYQVSQYDEPINVGGWLELPSGYRVGIERAHIEEDTGKSMHVGGAGRIHGADHSLVDYNRAGVPLVETVSRPDMHTAEQAREYVAELRAILVATGASDGKMEEGSLRVDANVSVRRGREAPLGTRCEIKNMNSLRSLGRAIDYEVARQIELLESGESIRQETRHWNEADGRTISGRSKEEADDYRYFPEPDLLPVVPDDRWLSRVREQLPVLPAQRRAKLLEAVGDDARASVATAVDMDLDALVIGSAAEGADARLALNRAVNELGGNPAGVSAVKPSAFATVIKMESSGQLTPTQAKTVIAELLDSGGDPVQIVKGRGFEAMSADALDSVVDELIAQHQDEATRLRAGDVKLMGFFVGKVMAATAGKADGKAITALLRRRLAP